MPEMDWFNIVPLLLLAVAVLMGIANSVKQRE